MGDEDLYVGNIRNYYNTQRIIVKADEHPGLICSSSFPDGKLNVEKIDVELLEEERVDYDTM